MKYHKVLRLSLLAEIAILFPFCLLVAYHNYIKFGLFYGIYWVVYPFLIAIVPILPNVIPKTYKTHLRGLFVNGFERIVKEFIKKRDILF
ncbi:hypothetical protein [Archaeoglobus sp.]